jgi:uncharacterized protein YndB with AHSA1/START domain
MSAPRRTHVAPQRDYKRGLLIEARRRPVFEALTTLDGLAGWWTPLVGGSPTAGGEITFGFEGIDETIVMHVEDVRPDTVSWTCLVHTGHPEWNGTSIVFQLHEPDDKTTLLELRHHGLVPTLDCYVACEHGWHHFLNSLAGYVERGEGTPFT